MSSSYNECFSCKEIFIHPLGGRCPHCLCEKFERHWDEEFDEAEGDELDDEVELVAYCSSDQCAGNKEMVKIDAKKDEGFCIGCGHAIYWVRNSDREADTTKKPRHSSRNRLFYVKKR